MFLPFVEVRWKKVYKKDPRDKSSQQQKKKSKLMLRSCFPHFVREHEIAYTQYHSKLVVIVNNEWDVGNLVDWWYDIFFWSREIGEKLDNNKVQIWMIDHFLLCKLKTS